MTRKLRCGIPLSLLVAVAAYGFTAESEDIEPPLKYTLIINGKPVDIVEGKPIRLAGELKNPEVTLNVDPHRTFIYLGVTFRYPRHFAFNTDLSDKEFRQWSVSGNDFKIKVFDLEGDITPAMYAGATSEAFGKGNWTTLDPRLRTRFGKHQLEGISAKGVADTNSLILDVYRVSSTRGRTRLLVLHYEAGKHTKEADAAIALLKESFVVTRQ